MFGDSTRTRSACASATPASASSTRLSGWLISFFIAAPHWVLVACLGWDDDLHDVVRERKVVGEVGEGGADEGADDRDRRVTPVGVPLARDWQHEVRNARA